MTRRASAIFARLIADRRGVSAVEFALIAPVMILIYFGLTEFSQAYMAQRRTGHTAAMVADLVAQGDKTSPTAIQPVFAIGQMIMKPFSADPLAIRVTSVTMGANGQATVDWSLSSKETILKRLGKASPIADLPPGLIATGESLIIGETQYKYQSAIKDILPEAIIFERTYYLRPRTVNQVVCTGC